ncbi:hypothetical protein [Streptomyces phage phiScoe1]|nr:hypothetical protein [Streptomyces phage phiScoe1]
MRSSAEADCSPVERRLPDAVFAIPSRVQQHLSSPTDLHVDLSASKV